MARQQRQVDLCELKASLVYSSAIVNSKTSRAT